MHSQCLFDTVTVYFVLVCDAALLKIQINRINRPLEQKTTCIWKESSTSDMTRLIY